MTLEEIRIEYNIVRCYTFFGLTLKHFDEVLENLMNDPKIQFIKISRRVDGVWIQ